MRTLTRRRFIFLLGAALLACLVMIGLAPFVGPTSIDFGRAFSDHSTLDFDIFFRARLPRVLFAALVGGALAISGVVFQAILRNPLASPFTLGISGGGSLGAVLAIRLGWENTYWGFSMLPFASFLGSLSIIVIVFLLSRSRHHVSPLTLLLSGVVLNFMCGALILLIHYFADLTQSFMMLRWTMGGLDVFEYRVLLNVIPFILVGFVLLTALSRYLNVLSAGEDLAASRGVNVKRLVSIQYFGASLMTGSVIAFCGPIGFVGLIVPHTLRLLVGADHRLLLPVSFFVGGAFLIVCDTVARTILSPVDIPVGIITAILGGPFFLWLLLSRKAKSFF